MRALKLLLTLLLLLAGFPATAQEGGPVYVIRNISTALVSDNAELRLQFNVINLGSDAAQGTTAAVLDTLASREIVQQSVPPQQSNDLETITFTIPVSELQPGSQSLRIRLSDSAGNELADSRITVNVPGTGAPAPDTGTPTTPGTTPPETTTPGFMIYDIRVDLTNPLHVLALVGFGIAALLFLFLILFALWLLLRRSPQFPPWQPPYATTPNLNPNSQAARRQGWQFHAQNDLPPPAPQQEGATHVRKLLTGLDGANLQNWRITGLRLSQYDQYGRVARSQVIAASGLARRLNRAAHRGSARSTEQTIRQMRPIARVLVNQFRRRVLARSAMLPLALDVRFQGAHGEVQVWFELFMVQGGQWQMIDHWEAETNATGKLIVENFTYTLHGMRPDETMKTFPQRLQGDITRLLVEMANKRPTTAQEVKEDTAQQKAVQVEAEAE